MPGTPAAQTDDVLRSATILPGVPLPAWALPEGPIAPEPTPEPAEDLVAEQDVAAQDAVAQDAAEEPEALGLQDTVAFGAYSVPLALAANGPAPMRAGWGYPRNEPSAPVEAPDSDTTTEIPAVPDDIAGITELTPPPVPLDAPDGSAESVDDTDAAVPDRSRRPLVLVGALGAVVVATAVAAFVWPGLLVTPEPEALPAKPAPVVAPARVTLAAPATVGGLTRVNGAADTALATAATTTALPGLSAPVSGVYGIGTTPAVTVIAWRNGAALDATAIESAFAGFTASSGAEVSDLVTVRVGDVAGQMRCGSTVVGATPASLCFWVDSASFGSVTVLRPASPEAGVETALAVRESVETTA